MNQGLLAIATLYFAREMGPSRFGDLGLVLAIGGLYSGILDLGASRRFTRDLATGLKDAEDFGHYWATKIFTGVIFLTAGALAWGLTSSFNFGAMALVGLAMSLKMTSQVLPNSRSDTKLISSALYVERGIFVVITIPAIFFGLPMNLELFTLAFVLGSLSGSSLIILKGLPRGWHRKVKLKNFWKANTAFSLTSLSQLARQDLDVLILQVIGASYLAGLITFAKKIILPIDSISMPILAMFGSSITRVISHNEPATVHLWRLLRFSLGINIIVALIGMNSGWIVMFTVGPSFLDAVAPLQILCLWYALNHVSGVLSLLISSLHDEKKGAVSDVSTTCLLAILLLLNLDNLDAVYVSISLVIVAGFRILFNIVILMTNQRKRLLYGSNPL
jgi:O-antigen/teichoic acid export membrane protein